MSDRTEQTFVAVEDLSTYQYFLVVNSTGGVGRVGTAGARLAGILQNKPKASEAADVTMLGYSRVKAGGTIALGDAISSTASGTATSAASGDYIIGQAITAVASGGIFDAMICHTGYKG